MGDTITRIDRAGVFYGIAYAYYDDDVTAANVLVAETFYSAGGQPVASETFAANGGYAITLGAALWQSRTVNPDGSYQVYTGMGGTFYGVAYDHYVQSFDSTGFRTLTTIYNAQGAVVASQTYQANGGFAITLNGALYYSETPNPDGSRDVIFGQSGDFYGVAYASYDVHSDSTGLRDLITIYDSHGNVVATQSFKTDGSSSITLNGKLYYAISYHPDGSYDVYSQAGGTFYGQVYTATDAVYSATGVLESAIFYNSNAGIVLSQQFHSGGVSAVALGAAFLNAVTSDYLNSLSPAEVLALTTSDLAAMPATAFSGVSVTFVDNLSPAAIAGLTSDQLAELSPAALAVLSPAQLGALTTAQIKGLTATEMQGFNPAFWSSSQWAQAAATWFANLTPDAIAKLTATMLAHAPAAAIDALDATVLGFKTNQVYALGPDVVAALDRGTKTFWSQPTPAWIQWLSPKAIGQLTNSELLSLSTGQNGQIYALGDDQIGVLAEANPPGFWSSVPASWINSLFPSALQGFQDDDLAIAELQPATIGLLSPAAFQALRPEWSALTPTQTAVLTPAQFGSVSVNNPAVFAQLKYPWALNVAVVAQLDDALLSSLPADDFLYFDAQWLNELPLGALDKLSKQQIQNILPQYFAYMNAAIVGSLTPTEIGDLTLAQLSQFTPADFLAMSADAIHALSDDDVASLALSQLAYVGLSNFTSAQVAHSPALQFLYGQSLTTAKAVGSVAGGIGAMTAPEVQALAPSVLFSLTSYPSAASNLIGFFKPQQLLAMSRQQYALISNYLTQTQHSYFAVNAVQASPSQIAKLASGWTSAAYGVGTMGDPAIWPHLSAAQVQALAASGAIAANGFAAAATEAAGFVPPTADALDGLNTYSDLISLPDNAFAGLGQGAGSAQVLAFLVADAYFGSFLIPADKVDTIAPEAWHAAVIALSGELTTLGYPSFYSTVAFSSFFDDETTTSFYVYEQSQINPTWLPSDPSTLTLAALRQFSAAQVQELTTAQLYSLSLAQYGAIYPKLSAAQAESLLFREIAALPAADQQTFLNAGGLSGDIQVLLNPQATSAQLFSGAFTTADQNAAQTVISIFDRNFPTIVAHPDQFKQLSTLYSLLEARSNALIANSSITAQITADVDSILNDFTLYNDGLTPTATPADGETDVTKYVSSVAGALNQTVGGIVSLSSDLKGLSAIIQNVEGLVLDNTTEARPLASLVKWALDGSANANAPAGTGNLTYDNTSGYTFQQALERIELDLFTNADNFVKQTDDQIAAVVHNNTVAQEQALISNILNITAAVASLGAGLGGLGNAIADIESVAEDTADIFKAVQTLKSVNEDAKSAASVLGNISAAVVNTIGTVAYTDVTSAAFTSSDPDGQYPNIGNSGSYVSAFVDDLIANLTSDDAIANQAIAAGKDFASNYRTLLANINTSLDNQATTLGAFSVEHTTINGVDAYNPNFVKLAAGLSPINTVDFDYTYKDSIAIQHNAHISNLYTDLPSSLPVAYTDPLGNAQVYNFNLADLFKDVGNALYIAQQGKNSDDFVNLNAPGSESRMGAYVTGPSIPGYASTIIGMGLVLNDSAEPLASNIWQLNGVTVFGHNPI